MDPNETMVENMDDVAADDALTEDIVEETDESEQSLEDFNAEDEGQAAEEPKKPETQGTGEPGYVKKRINAAVEKAVRETEARMRADFDRQMAPIREKMLNDEAKELVRQGEFKSLDRAKEYLQLKQGIAPSQDNPPEPQQQPRNSQGQFAPKSDPATSARIDMLAHQADQIKAETGIDVIEVFSNDPDIKQKVISGKMDFYDVAKGLKGPKGGGRKPPAPTRSPNGVNGIGPDSIWSMTDEQFARMDRKLDEGVRFTVKR